MNTRSFLKGLIYFCLALTPFLAWYVSNQTFFPFITGKNFAFRTLIEIAFAAYVVLAYIEPSYRPKKSVVLYTYTTFLVALLISNILGSNTYLSLFSNYERMEGWFTHLHIFLYFIILYSVYKSEHDWTKIFGWFMVSGIAVITEGLFQLFGQKDFFLTRLLTNNFVTRLNEAYPTHMGGGLRLDSSLGNAAYYGIYTLFFVFISLILAFKVNKWKGKQNYIPMFWVLLGAVMVLGQNLLNSYAVALAASAQTLASNLSSFANFLSLLGWVVIIVSGISFVKALSKNEIGSWPLALFSFVSIVSLVYTQTRGSYVGLVGGIIVAGLIYVFADRERKDKRIKRAILSVVAVIFISLGIIFAFKDYSFVKNNVAFNRIATIKLTNIALHPIDSYRMVANENNNYQALVDYFGEATIVSRFLNIKISIEGVSKDFKTFLLGYGQESYPKVFAENYDARMYAQETWFDRAHNVFMDWLVAGGIIGLIAYLSLYFTSIYMLWFAKGHKNIELSERTLLTGAMIAYFIHNIFVFDNLISYIIFVTLLAYIASRTRDTELHIKSENNENKKHNKLALSSVAGLSAAVSLIAFVFLVWKPLTANLELLGALRVFPTSYENIATTTESSYNKFMLALNKNTFGNREVEEQMIQKALILGQIDYKNMKEEDVDHFKTVVNNFINTSEVNMINGVNQYKTARGLSLLGSYFLQKGDAKSSLEYLSQANNINQTKQPIAFEYVQALIFNNQLSEALVVAQKAYNADTSYEQAGAIVDSLEKEIASSTNKVE